MNQTIENAKSSFQRASDTLVRIFNNTAPDRMNWSPSSTSRTPIQVVAHASHALRNIKKMYEGTPFPVKSTAEAEIVFAEFDRQFETVEAVLAEWNESSSEVLAFFDNLQESRLDDICTLPFGFGQAPLHAILSAVSDHTNWHAAQLEYIQTIYGDRDWHVGV